MYAKQNLYAPKKLLVKAMEQNLLW